MGIDYRTSMELRTKDDGDGFEGHAASWWSVDSYGTCFAPGAFKRTIRNRIDKIPVLWNHDDDHPIGKHIELKEDDHGLYVNVGIADDGSEGTTLIKRLRFGVPLGLSFGFETFKDRSPEDDDPIDMSNAPRWIGNDLTNVRVITEVKYWESSPVTFAANENSTIDTIRAARMEQEAEYLTSLLEDLRSGRLILGDARMPLLRSVVDAMGELSDPDPEPLLGTTPLAEGPGLQRNYHAEMVLASLGIS